MRRPSRILAGVTALVLLTSGCTLMDEYGKKDPSTSASSSAAGSPAVSVGASTGATEAGKTDPNDVPVAHYKKDEHEVWAKAPKAPDRTKLDSAAKPEGFTDPPEGQGMERYLKQKITWEPCGEFQCGTVVVPLDWDQPDGQAITLKMKKKEATDSKKLGTMFINPGGPGGSGQEYVTNFEADGFPGYDIIGWDPRGSGESTPVVCADKQKMDAYNNVDISPDDGKEFSALEKAQKDFANWCRESSGPLLDHISTIDNVRDLDYLRHLVGDKKLTYMGVSYGTFIGSVYAELYPKRVGRLVLDSAVNITDKDSVIQQMGFDLALEEFADWCPSQSPVMCPYGRTGDAVLENLTAWFKELDTTPIKDLNQNYGVLGVAAFLYSGKEAYPQLLTAINFARKMNEPKFLMLAAGFLIGKDAKGEYTPMAFSFPGIACKDSTDKGLAQVKPEWDDAKKKAPIFGTYMGPGMQCTFWTSTPMDQLKLVGKGAAPILVLGATGDPATPYQQAQWMAEQLDSGVLLTWKGAGHGVYSLGNACAKKAVEAYVNEGTVPKDKTTC